MNLLKKPKPSETCPPDFHVVRGHRRVCQSGTVTWVDAHIRRNRNSNLKMLLQENLLYLFWKANGPFRRIKSVNGFKGYHELDAVIQFWLRYWKQQGLVFPSLDPLLIKVLIAVESSFNPKAKPKSLKSSAYGLMQVTNQTRRILSGIRNKDGYREIRNHFLQLSRKDISDPVCNIAAGTRWLIHKYHKIPRGSLKNTFNAIKNYHSWTPDGEDYAKKIFKLYKKSK